MNKEIVIKVNNNGLFKVPLFLRLRDSKKKKYKILYKNKYYESEQKDKNIMQISQVVEALNIKDKKKRLEYIYDRACDILDSDFYGKNVCEFKDNRCIHDRKFKVSCDGCCRSNDGKKYCMYLVNHRCSIRCLACKFHVCSCIRKKGLKYRVNDILVIKYLLNFRQKCICYLNFFKTKEETIKDLYKNSIILWAFKKNKEKFLEEK